MKKIWMLLLPAMILLSGCARDLIVTEILQIPEHATIYTAYNLWYTDPMEMDTINTQKGNILPFGTAVIITKATERELCFSTQDGKKFRIEIEPHYRMQTPEEYVRDLLTLKTPEELRGKTSAIVYEKIRRGLVERGMTRGEVTLAYGPPCAYRTPDRAGATWIYPMDFLEYKRIVFSGEKVAHIIVP